VRIVSVAQMRALEAAAFAAGISEAELQLRAGQAVAKEVFRLVDRGARVAVFVGHGNNGRDGAVAAQWLIAHQAPVDLILAPRHALTPDEVARLEAAGASIIRSEFATGVETALRAAKLAVDALAGVGARGALREPLASLARQINTARVERGESLQVVALDIPSGIDPDRGDVPGEAVWADTTITLGAVKQGLLRFPAAERVGRLIAVDIGIPPGAETDLPYGLLDERELATLVPERPLDAHKYRFGRALVVAGSDHFPGAAVLCSAGAARIGAGLVTVASTREVRRTVAGHLPEVTYTIEEVRAADGALALKAIEPYLRSHNSAALGPGLGRGPGTTAFVAELLARRAPDHHLVIDADGLVALSEIKDWPRLVGPSVVLTPHSGELERLLGQELEREEPIWVQAGRLASTWGCVLVTKGPVTCIGNIDGRVDVWPRPNPALATGGTGDVLAGVTAGLLAQDIGAWDGARLAVGIHGLAAERVLQQHGWRTLLASDLPGELPAALHALRRPTRHR
jgi:ADP-dependent NAD(P)H-hydrate dehydratase / NAD(P)H-hydrate epimerase